MMKLLKLALVSLVVFFLLMTAFSLVIPSHIRVSRAADIPADAATLNSYLANPAKWASWFPGAGSASLYTENGEVRGILSGDGKKIVLKSVSDSSITAEYSLGPERASLTGWNYYSAGRPGTITVQWYMDFHLRWYPWEKFSGILLDKRYGPMMEQGLARLKTVVAPAE